MKKIIIVIVCVMCIVCFGALAVVLIKDKNVKNENKVDSISENEDNFVLENKTSKNENSLIDNMIEEDIAKDRVFGELQKLADKYVEEWCDKKGITVKSYNEFVMDLGDINVDGLDVDLQVEKLKESKKSGRKEKNDDAVALSDSYKEFSNDDVIKEMCRSKNAKFELEEGDVILLTLSKDGSQVISRKIVSD